MFFPSTWGRGIHQESTSIINHDLAPWLLLGPIISDQTDQTSQGRFCLAPVRDDEMPVAHARTLASKAGVAVLNAMPGTGQNCTHHLVEVPSVIFWSGIAH